MSEPKTIFVRLQLLDVNQMRDALAKMRALLAFCVPQRIVIRFDRRANASLARFKVSPPSARYFSMSWRTVVVVLGHIFAAR